jgi:flagellin-like protein
MIDALRDGDGDRAVSPVIGVILMVAITVILATVIGAVVLDFGNNAGDSSPSASLSVSASTSTSNVTIEHTGGDALQSDQTRVIVEVAGTSKTFDPSSESTALSVGKTADIRIGLASATNKTEYINWDGDNTNEYPQGSPSDDINAISEGDQITVTLIDTETQREIYSTTVTA